MTHVPNTSPEITLDVLAALRASGFDSTIGWTDDDLVTITPVVRGVRDDYTGQSGIPATENYVLFHARLGDTCGANLAVGAEGWTSFGPFDESEAYVRSHDSFETGVAWLAQALTRYAAEPPTPEGSASALDSDPATDAGASREATTDQGTPVAGDEVGFVFDEVGMVGNLDSSKGDCFGAPQAEVQLTDDVVGARKPETSERRTDGPFTSCIVDGVGAGGDAPAPTPNPKDDKRFTVTDTSFAATAENTHNSDSEKDDPTLYVYGYAGRHHMRRLLAEIHLPDLVTEELDVPNLLRFVAEGHADDVVGLLADAHARSLARFLDNPPTATDERAALKWSVLHNAEVLSLLTGALGPVVHTEHQGDEIR